MEATRFYSNSSDIWNTIRGIWMNEILFASFYLDFIHSGGPLCWLCILTFRNTLLYLHFRLSAENLSVESDCKRWNKFHFGCTFLIIKVSCLGSPVFCKVCALKQKGAVAKDKQHIMQWIMQLPLVSGGVDLHGDTCPALQMALRPRVSAEHFSITHFISDCWGEASESWNVWLMALSERLPSTPH